MKLIEKKCPNCGASLSFNDNDNSCICEYCKRIFEIERETNSKNNRGIDEMAEYNLTELENLANNYFKNFKLLDNHFDFLKILFFLFFFIIFGIFIFIFIQAFIGVNLSNINDISNSNLSKLILKLFL